VPIFFIAGLLYLLRFERVDNLGAYRIPPETGLLIPSGFVNYHEKLIALPFISAHVAAALVLPVWTRVAALIGL